MKPMSSNDRFVMAQGRKVGNIASADKKKDTKLGKDGDAGMLGMMDPDMNAAMKKMAKMKKSSLPKGLGHK